MLTNRRTHSRFKLLPLVIVTALAATLVTVSPAAAATTASQTRTITVQSVSTSSKVKTVPKVVGKTAYAAKTLLVKDGLSYKYKTPKGSFVALSKNWTVTKQSPKAKSKVKAGTTILLTVVKTSSLKSSAGAQTPYGVYPAAEAQFVNEVNTTETALGKASSSLQSASLISTRDAALCAALPGNAAANWVGTIHDIGANGDGYAWVNIEIAPTIVVQTWNNDFSDLTDQTLIKPSQPFFAKLVPMKIGEKVVFSGAFLSSSSSCLEKENLTQTFYGLDPNFIIRFSNVAAQ
jgi:hypothetical protein